MYSGFLPWRIYFREQRLSAVINSHLFWLVSSPQFCSSTIITRINYGVATQYSFSTYLVPFHHFSNTLLASNRGAAIFMSMYTNNSWTIILFWFITKQNDWLQPANKYRLQSIILQPVFVMNSTVTSTELRSTATYVSENQQRRNFLCLTIQQNGSSIRVFYPLFSMFHLTISNFQSYKHLGYILFLL